MTEFHSMRRGTGGNQFIHGDATILDLTRQIREQLLELTHYAEATPGFVFDLGRVSVDTQRISSGKISVNVTADLLRPPSQPAAGPSLIPRFIVAEKRLLEVDAAIDGYRRAGKDVPTEWIAEHEDLAQWLDEENRA